jgi:hypothetical protein
MLYHFVIRKDSTDLVRFIVRVSKRAHTCKYVLLRWSAWFWRSWLGSIAAVSDSVAAINED